MSTAYTTEKTWVTGDDITAALLNAHIRDNSQFLHQPPCCRVFNSANISVSNGAYNALTFNSERYNTDSMHSTAVNTSRITATTAGKYNAGGCIQYAAAAGGSIRAAAVRLNGLTIVGHMTTPSLGASASPQVNVSCDYALAAADYLELLAFQDSGAALNATVNGNYSPEFWASWQAA